MSELKKLGDKLRKARESKGYSIRDVSEKTHMSPMYIKALEEEDFSCFPSETYIIGFLSTYAEFLNFNSNEIIKEYKGLKLQNSESPLKELTSISKPKFEIASNLLIRYVLIVLIALGVVYLFYKFIEPISFSSHETNFVTSEPCNQREKKTIYIKDEESLLSLLDLFTYYEFYIGSEKIPLKLCITEIEKKENYENVKFTLDYKQKPYALEAKSGETIILSNTISELNQLNKKIELSIKVVSENTVQIELQSIAKAASTKSISITLEIVQETYIEWISDGKAYKGEFLKQGDVLPLEADNRLDIKIGNGAGVKFLREGFPPRIAGPPGKIVKLSLFKVPDPFDTTKFKIEEQIVVFQ
ncbi:MAG: helix-turn-helix domain-containing protein [Leptonema sp. (in: bacteria)]